MNDFLSDLTTSLPTAVLVAGFLIALGLWQVASSIDNLAYRLPTNLEKQKYYRETKRLISILAEIRQIYRDNNK